MHFDHSKIFVTIFALKFTESQKFQPSVRPLAFGCIDLWQPKVSQRWETFNFSRRPLAFGRPLVKPLKPSLFGFWDNLRFSSLSASISSFLLWFWILSSLDCLFQLGVTFQARSSKPRLLFKLKDALFLVESVLHFCSKSCIYNEPNNSNQGLVPSPLVVS